jgi:sugar phosphate isomerase/epimerase
MNPKKLICATNLYAAHPLETALQQIADMGFHYIDLWSCPAICEHVDYTAADPAGDVQKLLDKYDVKAVSLTAFLMTNRERKKRVALAEALHIPFIIWEPAQSVDWERNMTNLNPISVPFGKKDGDFWDYLAALREWGRYCSEHKQQVLIEVPHCYTHNEHLHNIIKTAREMKEENVAFVIAPPHADARGYTAYDVFDHIGVEKAQMLYLWDIQKEFVYPDSDRAFGRGDEQMPGGGRRDFAKLIRHFQDHGFQGWYNVSCHGTEGWQDVAAITTCLKKAYAIVAPLISEQEVKHG